MRSAVAGILDANDGLRVVVTERWRMRFHVNAGERLFVVPGLRVKEPVPWEEIPKVIETVQRHVGEILASRNNAAMQGDEP